MIKDFHTGSHAAHYLTFPFDAAGLEYGWRSVTGLESILTREIRLREERGADSDLVILSDGTRPLVEVPQARVHIMAATPEPATRPNVDKFAFWFDQMWAYLHPDAFTSASLSKTMLQVLYPKWYSSELGTLQQMLEHYERYGVLSRNPRATSDYADRFDHLFSLIPPGATVNWSDFFFADSMLRHAERLRARDVFQTFHSHSAHPRSLQYSESGRRFIKAMSLMDRVYLHTDRYLRAFEVQIEDLGYDMPELRRVDLGVDRRVLEEGLATVTSKNYERMVAGYSSLNSAQRQIIAEILRSRGSVSQRFICLDRLDPIKGTQTVLDAIDLYLESLNEDAGRLQRHYRFFFLMQYYESYPSIDPQNSWHQYANYVRTLTIPRLQKKYPGILYFSDNIPNRILIAPLVRDAHILSGGIQEGLGIAVQEALYVNALTGAATSGVVGDGAGFVIQAIDNGSGDLLEFPTRGNVVEFARAIRRIVEAEPQALRNRTARLVAREIEPRQDSVIVGRG